MEIQGIQYESDSRQETSLKKCYKKKFGINGKIDSNS